MVFNATFNNISGISWQSVLLVEETRVLWENPWTAATASHWQTLSHYVVSSTPRHDRDEDYKKNNNGTMCPMHMNAPASS
jgi:hypothetical protein